MVDALDLQRIQRAFDVTRRALFAGVRDATVALGPGAREYLGERLWREPAFAGVEADAGDARAVRFGHRQSVQRILRREVTQKAHD